MKILRVRMVQRNGKEPGNLGIPFDYDVGLTPSEGEREG